MTGSPWSQCWQSSSFPRTGFELRLCISVTVVLGRSTDSLQRQSRGLTEKLGLREGCNHTNRSDPAWDCCCRTPAFLDTWRDCISLRFTPQRWREGLCSAGLSIPPGS